MKRLTVRTISVLFGAGVAVIVASILLLLFFNRFEVSLIILIAAPVVSFILVLLITNIVLSLFVKEQIHPIYRTIHKIAPKNRIISNTLSGDLITEVEEEVRDWAESNKQEVEKLKGRENYRKEFLGNVYHELKTPIFNLQGYILTLLSGGLEDKSVNRVYLKRTEKNINRMISIVEDLESISGLESGALNLKIEKFSINRTCEDVIEANELKASGNSITLELEKVKDNHSIVTGDKKRIYQVLNNLVINSINYGIKNGRTIISLSRTGNSILVEVKDNGIGITQEDIPRVFERFYRVDKSRSRDSGGTGLGLAIAKHIMEAHKQTISLSSTPGTGSVFTFSLERD
ncbi:MAG: sensor histidine kinase [Bacteroidales bacterium]|nr:sensor histidine kinase [Bacteroidales bacterium]